MRPASDYRGARRNEARERGLIWRELDRELNQLNVVTGKVNRTVAKMPTAGRIETTRPIRVVLPHNPMAEKVNQAKVRNTMADQLKMERERLAGCAIRRGEQILHVKEGSHAMIRGYKDPEPGDIAGFWTTGQRFVDREEGKAIAIASGQLPESWVRAPREVLSSDIDWNGGLV